MLVQFFTGFPVLNWVLSTRFLLFDEIHDFECKLKLTSLSSRFPSFPVFPS